MVPVISPRELAVGIENGHSFRLLDVRQAWENEIAALPDSIHIPLNELTQRVVEINRDGSTLIVYCHHGVRSLSAANFLVRLGFIDVKSLTGGIDAWSCEVDPKVPRY